MCSSDLLTISTPAAAEAGTSLTFTVSLDAAAAAAVTVDYATADGTAVAGTGYTATSGTLTFAPGQTTATITVPLLIDANAAADTTPTFTLTLSDASGNAELDGGQATGSITNLPVESLPFGGRTRATFTDANGRTVVVSLAGPGSGTVTVVGDSGDVQAVSVAATDTTAASRLTVQTVGGGTTDLSGLAVAGSLATLNGADVDLLGDLTVTGTIRSLTLAGASGSHTLSIQGTGTNGVLNLGTVSGLAVTTAEPLAALIDTSWTAASTADLVTAPSIKLLQSKGDFAAGLNVAGTLAAARIGGALTGGIWTVGGAVGSITVLGNAAGTLSAASAKSINVRGNLTDATIALSAADATDLGSLVVVGTVSGSSIRAVGSIRAVRVGAMTGSTVFAGVGSAVTALPAATTDFAADASILSFTVAGAAFADSYVAAESLGHVVVDKVTTDNGGTPFGFAAESLASFADVEPGVATFRWTPKDGSAALTFNGDFKVRLV